MSRATDIKIVLAPSDGSTLESLRRAAGVRRFESDDLVVVGLMGDAAQMQSILQDQGLQKLFENTYFKSGVPAGERASLVSSYFDWLGTAYRSEIDTSNNRACYELLFDSAVRRAQRPSAVTLDFGCGPGTILGSSVISLADRLMGFDFSEEMRLLAGHSGLDVISRDAWESGSESFDFVLSTYVMHYGAVSERDIATVGTHMRDGAVWAMNFHKGIGVDEFLAQLRKCPRLVHVHTETNSPFGHLLFVQRRAA